MPIAFFFAVLFTLQRLAGDSELVVMASAPAIRCASWRCRCWRPRGS